jgi:PKD repeat protein
MFSWNFGDGTANVAGTPTSHTYTVKGTYTVKVNATDHNGFFASASSTITISPLALTASFTISPPIPCVGSTATFTASVSGGTAPYFFSWNFGDATKVVGNPVGHAYSVLGTFMVTLNVTDLNGFRTSVSHVITTADCHPFVFISGPSSGTVGTPVTFTATASGGLPPFSFSWNFGDGTPNVLGQTLSHTYSVKGTYAIRVNATDFAGSLVTSSAMITINPLTLAAGFTTSPASPIVGQPVTFTARPSGGTAPYLISWNFGDGTSTIGFQVVHSYIAVGTYTVTFSATDANGVTQTAKAIITVKQPDFAISPNPATLTLPPETSTTTTITLTSISGFTGTVSLNATITPTGKQGPFVTLSTTSVTITPGTPITVLLTVTAKGSTPLGSYTIILTATSGDLSHTITIQVTVTKEH